MITDLIIERRERSEANNRVLFEISRYLYIYMSVCMCIAQDCAHLTERRETHTPHPKCSHTLCTVST